MNRRLSPIRCVLLIAAPPAVCQAAELRDTMPDTCVAADALGRTLPTHDDVGGLRPNRTVGIFYFNWHAAFGNPAVYNIAKLVAAQPEAPAWGPVHAPHYWSEPRFGYYRPDDPWVIRKQMQLLAHAGIDVLILDATNGFTRADEMAVIGEQATNESIGPLKGMLAKLDPQMFASDRVPT